jgi:hypothetical protein
MTTFTWYELYETAILETDWNKIEERIHEAESAILKRQREFSSDHGGSQEENEAIQAALNSLRGLREDVASWRNNRFAS